MVVSPQGFVQQQPLSGRGGAWGKGELGSLSYWVNFGPWAKGKGDLSSLKQGPIGKEDGHGGTNQAEREGRGDGRVLAWVVYEGAWLILLFGFCSPTNIHTRPAIPLPSLSASLPRPAGLSVSLPHAHPPWPWACSPLHTEGSHTPPPSLPPGPEAGEGGPQRSQSPSCLHTATPGGPGAMGVGRQIRRYISTYT